MNDADETFKSHSGVDMFRSEVDEAAVSHTVKLHKHKVPYLDDFWIIFVYEFFTIDEFTLFFIADVDMYFRTWTARTLVAHFPEVVFLATVNDSRLVDMFFPKFKGFVIRF